MNNSQKIFKNASSTYYYASLLFPKDVRDDVFTLYAFVRTADDLVDSIPQKNKEFHEFRRQVNRAFAGKKVDNRIIANFFSLHKKKNFKREWTESFLDAMESDLKTPTYETFKALEKYMYGSAEVIGLYMAAIMDLPQESYETARLQGKAMQLINFIRDVSEDTEMGRQYIPTEDLKKFNLNSLEIKTEQQKQQFSKLIRFEIDRYRRIQREARDGYSYIRKTNRIPIQTAASLYAWTAERIYENPLVVFEKKVKPSKARLFGMYFTQYLSL